MYIYGCTGYNLYFILHLFCRCDGIPKLAMTDDDGEILCSQCAKDMDNVIQSKAIRKVISKLKIRCLSVIDNDNEGRGNIIATMIKDNECEWTGMIKELDEHEKECPFWIIQCDECKQYECQRQLMATHLDECPEVSIQCPLNCGLLYLYMFIYIYMIYDMIYINYKELLS